MMRGPALFAHTHISCDVLLPHPRTCFPFSAALVFPGPCWALRPLRTGPGQPARGAQGTGNAARRRAALGASLRARPVPRLGSPGESSSPHARLPEVRADSELPALEALRESFQCSRRQFLSTNASSPTPLRRAFPTGQFCSGACCGGMGPAFGFLLLVWTPRLLVLARQGALFQPAVCLLNAKHSLKAATQLRTIFIYSVTASRKGSRAAARSTFFSISSTQSSSMSSQVDTWCRDLA